MPSPSTPSCSPPSPPSASPATPTSPSPIRPSSWCSSRRPSADGRLNHLGVEVEDSDAVWAHQTRLAEEGVDSLEESGTCCFAKQDKVWVDGPDGAWEIYAVLADSDAFGQSSAKVDDQSGDSLCCASVPEPRALP